jgi:hypothetical protein
LPGGERLGVDVGVELDQLLDAHVRLLGDRAERVTGLDLVGARAFLSAVALG